MVAAAGPSQLGPTLAGRTRPGLGAAAHGIADAAQLAQLHTLVVQATPLSQLVLAIGMLLGDGTAAPGDRLLHPHVLGQLLDVL